MLAEVGALYNVFYAGGYMVSLTFSYNLMMSSLIGKLYGFNARFPDKEIKKKPKKPKKEKKPTIEEVQFNGKDSADEEDGDINQQLREIKKMYKQE